MAAAGWRFDGKVSVVTGGASGIGRAVAQRFAAQGATVVVADVQAAAAEVVAQDIGKGGGQAKAYPVDVAKLPSVEAFAEAVMAEVGRVDHLVNCAGMSFATPLAELDEAAYAHVLDIDLGGVYRLSRALTTGLRAAGDACPGEAAIVNVASVMAWFSAPGHVAYSAAKAGVLGITRAMALELGPSVRVNAICPGYIDTAIWQRNLDVMEAQTPGASAAYAERIRARHPVGRRGLPEDVAAAAAFLCSSDAAFISSTELVVDGGMSANALSQDGGY